MKKNIIFLFSYFLIFLFSCKQTRTNNNKLTKEKNDSLYIPKYSIIKPSYNPNLYKNLDYSMSNLYKKIQLEFRKGFLEDPLDDESDVYGHPEYDYGALIVWNTSKYPREEIYFNAKKINKEYSFYYENNKLICVLEGMYDDNAVFHGDSLFFNDKGIFLWKNTNNSFVNDSLVLDGKSKYIMRLDREIKEIKSLGFTNYIDNYIYKNDSLSNFVIGNLR